jgi:heme exporter protein B
VPLASKARQQASLIAILGLPVYCSPTCFIGQAFKSAYGEVFKEGAVLQLSGLLLGLDVLVIIMAFILFPYLWKD